MLRPLRGLPAGLLVATLLGAAGGCLLLAPLDDLPPTVEGAAGQAGAPPGEVTGGAGAFAGVAGAAGAAGEAGEPPAGGQPSTGGCKSDLECVRLHGDEPFRCRSSDHTCQEVKTDVCPVVKGSFGEPNAIYLGAFAGLNPLSPEDNPIVFAHQLALEELTGDSVGGLPDGPGGTRRPLVMVVCDNSTRELSEAGLAHLIQDLEVPAVLASLEPGDLRRGYEKYSGSDVFYFSPVTVSQLVADETDHDLIWNLLGQIGDYAPAYVKLLERTEAYLRTKPDIGEEPIRVALLRTNEAFDTDLADALTPVLKFNQLPVSQNDKNFQGFSVDSAGADLDAKVHDLVEFRPHIIVSAAGGVMTMPNGLLQQIEALWEYTGIPGYEQRLPTYLLSPTNAGSWPVVVELLKNLAESTGEALPENRFFGLAVADPPNSSLLNGFKTRLGIRFKGAYNDTANYYDAMYYLAYAMYGAGTDAPLSGSRIAAGMKRLLTGKTLAPGTRDISSIFKVLSDPSATITLESTLGPPGFDPHTGVRPFDTSVFCFKREDPDISIQFDARRFNRDSREFEGSAPFCFPGLLP